MIIEATRKRIGSGVLENISVAIDPFNVLCDLVSDWKASIGVACDSPLMGGYWMFYDDAEETYTRIRLATREEIVRFEVFKEITAYTATLFS